MELILTIEQGGDWDFNIPKQQTKTFQQINITTVRITSFPIAIGRNPDDAYPTITINNKYVSSKHLMILPTKEGFDIFDQKSTNGTAVIHQKKLQNVPKLTPFVLQPEDRIVLAPQSSNPAVLRAYFQKTQSSPQQLIEKNLKLMTEKGKGKMVDVVLKESIGGNAGTWNKYPCAGANFYYDDETGEIIIFGNTQNIPQDIKTKYNTGTFIIAIDFKKTGKFRIVDIIQDKPGTEKANKILEAAAQEYNQRYGFKP